MTLLDFTKFSADGWLDAIPAYQREAVTELIGTGRTETEIVELWLNRIGPESNVGFGGAGSVITYFSNFSDEMDAFICGDERYEKERAKAALVWEKHGKSGFVAFVAGFIATKINLAAVALVPVVALFFALVGKMGVGAYCRMRRKST